MSPYFVSYTNFPISRKSYHRPFREVDSYLPVNLENGTTNLYINALGIDKNDISVTVTQSEEYSGYILNGSGETETKDLGKFSFEYHFPTKKIAKITKELKNGILILNLEWEKPVNPDVEIVEL